jgi:hypothetical protein
MKHSGPSLIIRDNRAVEGNACERRQGLNQLCGSGLEPENIERILNALSEAGIRLEEA